MPERQLPRGVGRTPATDVSAAKPSGRDTGGGILVYPLDSTTGKEMMVVFAPRELPSVDIGEQVKFEDAFELSQRSGNTQFGANGTEETPGSVSSSGGASFKSTGKYLDPIALYCPQQVQFSDGMAYNEFSLGLLGATAEATIQAGMDVNLASLTGDAMVNGLSGLIGGITATLNTQAGAVAAQRVASKFGGDSLSGAVSSATQTSVHPNIRTLFSGVNTRRFTFNFTLIAKSAEEAVEIENIVKRFRTEMYPEEIVVSKINGKGVPVGYRYPPRWSITFLDLDTGDELFNQKIRDSYLVSMSTTYNSGAATFHEDGKPTQVEISLSFMEDRPLSKTDIKAGY